MKTLGVGEEGIGPRGKSLFVESAREFDFADGFGGFVFELVILIPWGELGFDENKNYPRDDSGVGGWQT